MSTHDSLWRQSLLTIPNIVCSFRIVGSGVLIALAWADHQTAAFGLTIALLISDWLDGKLAILLEQRSSFGAKLDSFADLSMYVCVILAIWLLYPGTIRSHAMWIALAAASYVLSIAASLLRFREWPSYHTHSAKASWLAAAIAIISALAQWSDWPIRIALALVTLANIEATVITFILQKPEVNVPTFLHALRLKREQTPER